MSLALCSRWLNSKLKKVDMSLAETSTEVLQLGTHRFTSRLIVGTGKYADYQLMGESLERSGTECITVAIRRERLIDSAGKICSISLIRTVTRCCRIRLVASMRMMQS